MFQPGANIYTQGFGSRPENVEVPHLDVRNPSVSDINFPVGKTWINTVSKSFFFLPNFSVVNGVTQANWTSAADSIGSVQSLSDGTTKVSPDITGNIQITGTANEISVTSNPGSNDLSLSIPSSLIVPGSLQVTSGSILNGATDIETGASPFNLNTSPDSTGEVNIGNVAGGALNFESGTGISFDPDVGDISVGLSSSTTGTRIFLNPGSGGGYIELHGGQATIVNVAGSGSTNISNSLFFVPVDVSGGVATIVLPASPTLGQHFVITDFTGNAAANNITINGNGHNINGAATQVLSTNYQGVDLRYTGSVWSMY
jgi:hypothetical protein